jgi:ABC-type Na+ efflux pump permease subunit
LTILLVDSVGDASAFFPFFLFFFFFSGVSTAADSDAGDKREEINSTK